MLSLFLTGCSADGSEGGNAVSRPDNLLSEEKMAEAILATQILEAKLVENNNGIGQDSSLKLYQEYEKKVFAKLGTDSTTYYQSHAYYLTDLETYKKLITTVTDSVEAKRDRQKEVEGIKNIDEK